MAGKLVYDFLGGIRFISYNSVYDRYEISLGAVARWLFGFALAFLVMGVVVTGKRQIGMYTVVRHKNKRSWWKRHFLSCVLSGLAAALVYWMVLHILDRSLGLAAGEPVQEALILLLWLAHILIMLCMYCFLDQTALSGLAAVILLMTEALTLVIAFFCCLYFVDISKFLFGTWGMYMQSKWTDAVNGFPVLPVLFTECGMMALSFLAGLWRMRRRDWDYQEDKNGTCY